MIMMKYGSNYIIMTLHSHIRLETYTDDGITYIASCIFNIDSKISSHIIFHRIVWWRLISVIFIVYIVSLSGVGRERRVNGLNFAKTSYRWTCAGPRLPAGSSLCSNTLFRHPVVNLRARCVGAHHNVSSYRHYFSPRAIPRSRVVSHDLSIIATTLTADELFSIMCLDTGNLCRSNICRRLFIIEKRHFQ